MLNDVIRTLSFLQPRADDDFVDQLHYYYTTTFLIIMAVLVSFKMFAGRPMECWIPAEYPKHWADFAEMYCWAQNTYWLPFDEDLLPHREEARNYRQISYYQWVPFFLLFQAMFFYMPCLIWRFFNVRSGVIMEDILAVARDPQNIHPEVRQRNIEALAVHLESVFEHRFKLSRKKQMGDNGGICRYCDMRYYDGYMTTLYIVIKTLYLINVTGQLFLMNIFLQTSSSPDGSYTLYGFGVLMDLLRGEPWQISGYFPRTTMCDMQIRTLGNIQRHTVQCVLALNIFNEKIFILLWFLYSILVACTVFSLLYWIFESFSLEARTRFLLRHLELAGLGYACTYKKRSGKGSGKGNMASRWWWRRLSKTDMMNKNGKAKLQRQMSSPAEWLAAASHQRLTNRVTSFSREFVKLDGSFVLRMLTTHAGVMFTAELVEALWQLYHDRMDAHKNDINSTDATLRLRGSRSPAGFSKQFGDGRRKATIREEDEEEEISDDQDGSGKEQVNYFVPTSMDVKPRPMQRRSSIMTLSTRQSLQQRRLSNRRMAIGRRSISSPQMPSYV